MSSTSLTATTTATATTTTATSTTTTTPQFEHKCVEKSFKTPTFCDVCAGFILPFKKAQRCSVCFLVAHAKCTPAANCVNHDEGELAPEPELKWLDIAKNSDLSSMPLFLFS